MGRLTVALIFICSQISLAQITGLPGIDPNAMPISAADISVLHNKKWNCEKIVETRRGEVMERELRTSITFLEDGKFIESFLHSGNWTTVENKFVNITGVQKGKLAARVLMRGSYSVYKITDSTLVLGQILTSSGDWKKEYWFSIKDQVRSYSHSYFQWLKSDSSVYDGERKVYDTKGNLIAIENYKLETGKITSRNFSNFNRTIQQINQSDSTYKISIRIGEWKTFYPDGKLESIGNYDDGNPIGEFIEYYPDGRLKKVTNYGDNYYTDSYYYPPNSTTQVVERPWGGKIFHIVGYDDCVQFDHLEVYVESRSTVSAEEVFGVMNMSEKETIVSVDDGTFEATRDSFRLFQLEVVPIKVRFKIPGGVAKGTIKLSTSEWTYELPIKSVGYELTTDDFLSKMTRSLPTNFYYFKTGGEYQLEISGQKGKDQIIPISKPLSAIQLNPGEYKMSIVAPTGKKTIRVVIR